MTMSSVRFLSEKVSGPTGLSTLCTIPVNAFANIIPFKKLGFLCSQSRCQQLHPQFLRKWASFSSC